LILTWVFLKDKIDGFIDCS